MDTEQFKKTVKSGLFSGGGIGVTIGKQELSQATKTSQETHQGSVVASVAGDVDIYAGGKYRQVGSEVQAPQGDVTIKGKSIDIVEARNQSAQDTETRFRQSGLSLSLSAPGVDAAMGAIKAGEHVTQTQDDRMKALAAATAISKAKQAVEEIQKFNDLAKAQQEQSIRISLSVGSQQSKSSQHNEANQAAGSSVLADGKLSLIATGGGQDSNVTVRGSTLAGQDVFIKADNKIDLLAAQNTSEQHSKDSSSSASIGIGISLGQENRLGFTASASVSKGNADGKDTNYSATQVTGGSSVTLQSGGDTTLGGAVVTAPKVVADIGGNLKIESLQDTAKFDSKSQSMGGSVTVGYGAGGSANFSQSKVNADYAAVGEQAGIRAGDGGFQVSVKGNTELKGGAITSSQAAIDAGKNSFSTGTLTSSDIDNRSQFSASAVTVSAGTSGGMAGAFKDSGDERSTTRSTISAGSTTITSGDAASQATLEKLDRGATNDATAGKLSQGWDGQKLSQQVKVNAQIVAEFGAQASKEVAGQLDKKAQQLRAEGKIDEAKKYEEGGEYRVAAHAVIGAITGDLSGALGAAASAKVADRLNGLQSTLEQKLINAGLGPDDEGKNDWASGLAKLATGALAAGIGAAAGGGFDGTVAGVNQDFNNRQLHVNERKLIENLAERRAKEVCGANPSCDPNKYAAALADAMQRVAEARVDSEKASETKAYFAELVAFASKNPSSVAALGGLDNYNGLLQEAKNLLDPYVGKTIVVNGKVQMLNGSEQTYFKATDAQRENSYGNTLGFKPTESVIPGMNARDENRVDNLKAQLGSAVPDTSLEEILLGAAVEKRIAASIGRWLSAEAKVALPNGYTARADGKVIGPNGGILDRVGTTADGQPVFARAETSEFFTVDSFYGTQKPVTRSTPGVAWRVGSDAAEQVAINGANGRAFQNAFNQSLELSQNFKLVTVEIRPGVKVTTIPDNLGRPAGMVELKDVVDLSMNDQFRAQIQFAVENRLPYNLVVSPTNKVISEPLWTAIREMGGKVYVFDPAKDTLVEVTRRPR